MQIKRSLLTLYSCLLVVVPTAMILAVGVLTRDVVIILLPWVLGPILGVFTAKLWFSHRMLPKAEPSHVPDPALRRDAFAVSGIQFFPAHTNYNEPSPKAPERRVYPAAKLLSWVGLILAWIGCLIPAFCIFASSLAILPAAALFSGRCGASWKDLPCSVRRRSLTGLCLTVAGFWSSFLIIYFSVTLT